MRMLRYNIEFNKRSIISAFRWVFFAILLIAMLLPETWLHEDASGSFHIPASIEPVLWGCLFLLLLSLQFEVRLLSDAVSGMVAHRHNLAQESETRDETQRDARDLDLG